MVVCGGVYQKSGLVVWLTIEGD
uniref:Uncharacterized protein n=1 Tax=Rhizophora mucronata TaxID=61149 RepID=A0A2P2R1F2_RHIMU